jgi:hypothetical protein
MNLSNNHESKSFLSFFIIHILLLSASNNIYSQSFVGDCKCTPCSNCTSVGGVQSPKYARPTDILLPVELASFTAKVDRNDVTLNWSTALEINNASFDVERTKVTGQTQQDWSNIGTVKGKGTTEEPSSYTFEDKSLATGRYKYRLKQTDFNGNFTYYNLSGEVEVGIPTVYRLSQNYPNPFNPVTKIEYDLPYDSKVSILIIDMLGREVAKLVNQTQTAGYLSVSFNASNLSSGAYFYRISAEGNAGQKFTDTKKMIVLK